MSNKASEYDVLSSDKVDLRVALYSDVIKICEETFRHLGLGTSQSAMMIIAELVYQKLLMYPLDLEAFANHAKRTSINTEDVRLLVRRNPSLKAHLISKYPDIPAAVQRRRKTTPNNQTPNITLKKRKIEYNNNINLPSTSRDRASPIL